MGSCVIAFVTFAVIQAPHLKGGRGRSLSSAVFPEPPSSRGFSFLFSGYRTASRAVLHPKFLPPFLQSLKSPSVVHFTFLCPIC